MGPLQVELSLLDIRLGSLHQSLRTEFRLDLRIKLALSDGSRLRQRRVSLDIEPRLAKLRLRLRELALCLIECGLERTRVDLKEYIALSHNRSFFVVLPDDVPGNVRLDLRVYVPVQYCHPFAVDRRVLLHNRGDFYDQWRRNWRRFAAAAAGEEQQKTPKEQYFKGPAAY